MERWQLNVALYPSRNMKKFREHGEPRRTTKMHLLAELLTGFRNMPTSNTDHLAWRCVLKIFNATDPQDFIRNSVKNFAPNIRRAALLKLMSLQNFKLEIDYETVTTNIMAPALALLLEVESDLKVLDLTGIVSFSPADERFEHLEVAIIEVSERATNLLSLSILQEEFLRVAQEEILSREYIEAFGKMEHLQVLRIEDFDIHLQDLMELCRKLRDLRFISVNIYEEEFKIPTKGELQKSFQLLKAFFFQTNACMHKIFEFKNLCATQLPNLQVIKDFASDFCCQSEYQYAPHKKEGRNLRHLELNFQYEKPEEGLHELFPYVTHLMIEGPNSFSDDEFQIESDNEWQIEPLLHFSEIESLKLSFVPPEIALQLVTTYKMKLHSLYLGNSICPKDFESTLDGIFNICPKLERVGLVNIEGPAFQLNNLTLLKEVMLKYEAVFDILIAPNLEKVTLMGQVVNEDDLMRLTGLISKKEALRKLETLVVRMQCLSITEVEQPFFLALADFIKTAARVLPTLSDLQLRVNHMCNYVILAESMKHGIFANDEIPSVEQFFTPGTDFGQFQWSPRVGFKEWIEGAFADALLLPDQ
ncbi:Hypothetical predicted protein [Cloeon dipterum]|uniref:Uncharacterized protein n=1 Tax=Cloeon dipterum TaxID=197152 RepID=A0A8S1DI95_9INSE|nr:Hypothetical predicted protein [Cloeon dipterum]